MVADRMAQAKDRQILVAKPSIDDDDAQVGQVGAKIAHRRDPVRPRCRRHDQNLVIVEMRRGKGRDGECLGAVAPGIAATDDDQRDQVLAAQAAELGRDRGRIARPDRRAGRGIAHAS